jgi:hypothetical protein
MIACVKAMVGLGKHGNEVCMIGRQSLLGLAFTQLRMRDGRMIGHGQ